MVRYFPVITFFYPLLSADTYYFFQIPLSLSDTINYINQNFLNFKERQIRLFILHKKNSITLLLLLLFEFTSL
jgi:hypothetical protein